jgi:hypothetical protein
MRRGCNDCAVGPGRPPFLRELSGDEVHASCRTSGSTALTIVRGAQRQSRRLLPMPGGFAVTCTVNRQGYISKQLRRVRPI